MISAKRVAIGAGVIALVMLFDVFCMVRVPAFVVGLFGGPTGGVARYGGVVARWVPPPGLDVDALGERFAQRGVGAARLRRDGGAVVVEIPNVREVDAPQVTAMMTEGGLEFREVIESMAAYDLIKMGLAFDTPRHGSAEQEPTIDLDQWQPEDGGPMHQDAYARAHSRDALLAMFADAQRHGWRQPPHTVVMLQQEEPLSWRSYLVSDAVALDGMSIAAATGSFDPNTNRPTVLLDFDRAGGQLFGDLTARIVGHKLAIVFGGNVRSAPIINGPIRGGRASITMGSSEPRKQERERDLLVQTLRAGTLPLGGTILESHWVAPGGGTSEWIGRVAIALAGGLVAGALAWFAIMFAKPERRTYVHIEGTQGRGKRLAWTLLAVGLYFFGLFIAVPWINDVELTHILYKGGGARALMHAADTSIFGLGMAPLLSSFILVEVVATLVPQLRRYRDGGADRRRWLSLAVVAIALVTATLQAYFITRYFDSMSFYGIELIDPGGRWPTIVTLVAGAMCLAWLASIISERGIGNGYAVLTIASLGVAIFRYWYWDGELVRAHVLLVAVAVIAIVVVTLAMLRWQVRSPRSVAIPIPASGITPLNPGAGAMILIAQVLALGLTAPTGIISALDNLQRGVGVGVIVVLVGTAAWAIAFAWPGRRAAELAKVDRDPADLNVWSRAVVLSIGALVAISAIARVVTKLAPEFGFLVDPLLLLLVVAAVMDFGAEWRARRRELVAVWPLHDPLLVDVVADRLARAGIPHHIQTTRLRSLLWLFGSFAPMMVLVPREHGEVAQSLLREWLQPT